MATAPKVLLVEADGAVRASLEFALALEGFEVEAVESVNELSTEDMPPAGGCLIIDQELRGADGTSLLAALRRQGCMLPAVLIATNPTRALRDAAARAGAALVEKPLLGDTLSNLLWELTRRPPEVA
jgi:two-component system response regulator FixJ